MIGGDGASRRRTGSSLPLVIFSVILLLVILTFILKSLVSRWLRRFGEPDYASKVYGKMCFLASLARLGPGLQQTPVEYCIALTSVFPWQAEDLNNIAQAYVESRFSRRKELESMQKGRLYQSWCRVYPIILKHLFRMRY